MAKSARSDSRSRVVTTSCDYDCGGRCLLKVLVKEGAITRIDTEEGPMPGLKACPRGLAQKEVVYAEDRLRQPLKRAGKRGSGEFRPISWEEALDSVARELQRVKDRYGSRAIFLMDHTGSQGGLHNVQKAGRRFFLFSEATLPGGAIRPWKPPFFPRWLLLAPPSPEPAVTIFSMPDCSLCGVGTRWSPASAPTPSTTCPGQRSREPELSASTRGTHLRRKRWPNSGYP